MKRWFAVLAVGALSLTVVSAASGKASTVVIPGYELGFFNGSVKSKTVACKQNRRVELWEQKTDGTESFLGFVKTDNFGRFSINDTDGNGGDYYAIAKPKKGKFKKSGKKFTCTEVTSPIFTR